MKNNQQNNIEGLINWKVWVIMNEVFMDFINILNNSPQESYQSENLLTQGKIGLSSVDINKNE